MAHTISHPDAAHEAAHLKDTLALIQKERAVAAEEERQAHEELEHASKYAPDDVPVREMVYYRTAQLVRNMDLASARPYFTRVDFKEHQGEENIYYIGKYGVLRRDTLEPVVIDWRSPVANLYYSGQVGPMNYTAPDGQVSGELTLKRQFGIEKGELLTIFDTDVVSQDAYLQSVLGSMSGDRLREIVTTIQAEQNFVIRHGLDRALVVQGVAGSGKTTIALHRVAYLLYAFENRLSPEHMLIVAPNPLFLNYISGVLPDLGVERVWQTTFPGLLKSYLGAALPRVVSSDVLTGRLEMTGEEREAHARLGRIKGAIELGRRIEMWMDDFEKNAVPEGDITFGPVVLYTHRQLRDFYLKDLAPFPLARRLKEFQKQLTRRVKEAQRQVAAWLMEECARRADQIKISMPDGPLRRERLIRLYDSRDVRIAQSKDQIKPFIAQVMARFPDMKPLSCYALFWQDMQKQPEYESAARHTLSVLAQNRVEPEDVAPLGILAGRLIELKRLDIRHTVVDEAQDFSPLEFELLKRISGSQSMTIVGDLMQGVNSWRGLQDWNELIDGVLSGDATIHHLVTSYRNTVEIMEMALRVARNRPVPGQREARPVLRHGAPPEIALVEDARGQRARIEAGVREFLAEGLSTVAVICRDMAEAKRVAEALPAEFSAGVLDIEGSEYKGGVFAAPASAVKGLEFDGVIMADVSRAQFPDEELFARMLYVCLTRPLHRLLCISVGEITPLLRA